MAAVSHAPASLTVLDPDEHPGHSERRGLHVQATGVARVLRRGSRILDDVTLAIEPGEVVGIIGTSGAGKTTLLDALAGVHPASHGTVRYDGLDIAQHGRRFRTLVGYVPQDDIIHRDLAVETTLRYAARLRLPDDRAEAIDRAVQHTLETLDLLDRAAVRVGSLSGGQRKRVSIAAELLTRPRALFLDEPTSGLDPGTARALMTTLGRLAGEGTTVVLTTHNPDDLAGFDRQRDVVEDPGPSPEHAGDIRGPHLEAGAPTGFGLVEDGEGCGSVRDGGHGGLLGWWGLNVGSRPSLGLPATGRATLRRQPI